MRRPTLAVRVALLIVCSLVITALVQAQYRTSIQGVVTDPSGAVVSGATLTLTDPATGQVQVRTSNDDGVFNFNALANTHFKLEVEKTGFQKKLLDNVDLIREQANALNVQLDLGSEATTVNVNASAAPAMDTETASVNGVVTSNQIQHMPSFGRDVTKLTQLAPGSFGDGSQGGGGSAGQFYNLPGVQSGASQSGGQVGIFATENLSPIFSNGNQVENNGISIDGISTTSAVWGGSTVITPSEDSVEDVKIVSNNYDSEYGRFSGSQIQITSKSGTNQYHGSLFFFTHQPNLNAYQPFNGYGLPVTRDNDHFEQFGGSVGGPIWKNKIFAFFDYETVREPNSIAQGNGWYDTPGFDGLAPSGSIAAQYLNFPGNPIVGTLNPNAGCTQAGLTTTGPHANCVDIPGQGINVGTPLTAPLGSQDLGWTSTATPGTGGDGSGGPENLGTTADLANYLTLTPVTFTATQYNGRLDYDITGKDRIGYAMYWVPLTTTKYNGNRGYDLFHHNQINDAFSGIWNHTFSPTMLNEARFNAAGYRYNEVSSNPQSPVGFPVSTIGEIGSITPGQFGPSVGNILNQWTYTWKDVATKIIGRNTIKFGGEVTRLFYLQEQTYNGVPNYSFFNMWDFLNDAPHTEGGGFNPATGIPTTLRQDDRSTIWGFFGQDDIKLRPNLTINLGLRWSYFGALSSKQGNMYVATPGAGSNYMTGLVVRPGHSWTPQKDNLGPQIGFAWSPAAANSKLVLRGGYGINYNQEEIAISANILANPGLVVFPTLVMSSPTAPNPGIFYALSASPTDLYGFPPNPATISTSGPNGLPTSGAPVGVEIFPGTLPTQLVHHYSFDMQYDMGHQLVASLGYQGSLGRNLFFHESPNAVPAASGYTLNPQITGGDYWGVGGHSNYNAMIAELKHQFATQFMADAQFTWAKSLDTSAAPYFEQPYPYNINLNYGRSDYNVAKAFKLFGMWQPVFFHGNKGWVEKIAGGWSLSGIWNVHSGFPWTPVLTFSGSLYCGSCGYGTLWPAAYLGGAGSSTSNNAFKGPVSTNFPLVGSVGNASSYFSTPTFTAYTGSAYGNALPQSPGVQRNSLNMPGYKDLDLTIAKGFGLPTMPVFGESARIELRMDAYNVFNNLNLNPNNIQNNIGVSNFGTITAGLAARVLTLGARFSF